MALSATQRKIVDLARRSGGELLYQNGGYWTHPSAKCGPPGPLGTGRWGSGPWTNQPDWAETRTIDSLVRQGVMEFTDDRRHGRHCRVRLVQEHV